MRKTKFTSVDAYLDALSADKRSALQKLRKTIRAAAPDAEECISYQIPAFRLHGVLVGFSASANHCAFYPMNSSTVAAPDATLPRGDGVGAGRLQSGPHRCEAGSWPKRGFRVDFVDRDPCRSDDPRRCMPWAGHAGTIR